MIERRPGDPRRGLCEMAVKVVVSGDGTNIVDLKTGNDYPQEYTVPNGGNVLLQVNLTDQYARKYHIVDFDNDNPPKAKVWEGDSNDPVVLGGEYINSKITRSAGYDTSRQVVIKHIK